MAQSVIQTSFSSGEVSPGLWGRVDLAKFRTGLARARNVFVEYKGGASNRPGTRYVGRALIDSSHVELIPFTFSTLQTYILEFGELYMRVIKDGGYVLDSAYTRTILAVTTGAVTAIQTSAGHGLSTGDIITIYGADVGWLNDTWQVTVIDADEFYINTILGEDVNTSNSTVFPAWTSGGTVSRPYKVTTPWAAEDLRRLKYDQSADTMTVVHPDYPIYDITRTAHDNWTVTQVNTVASISAPTGQAASATGAGTARYLYVVTAVDANGQESVASGDARDTGDNISTTAGSVTVTWSPVSGASYYNIYRAPIGAAADIPVGTQAGYVGTAFGTEFVDSNIVPDFTRSPPLRYNPFAPGQITAVEVTAGGAGYAASTVTVAVTGGGGSGCTMRGIVNTAGAVVSLIITNPGSGYTSAPTVTISGGGGAGATATATVGPQTGTYPSVCTYFQQRKWYAATTNRPETIFASRTGAYKNFDKSIPTVDSDSLELTLSSLQVNSVKWLVPMPGGIVTLTSGGAWQISGGGNNEPVTPSKATATPQAYSGCSDVRPLVINYDILYIQGGALVRALAYNFFINIYTGVDLTLLSSHLFDGREIVRWCWAEKPHRVAWAVRDDGILLSCTYVKDQEIAGWCRSDTQGLFKSIAVVQEGNDDAIYAVVERYINGAWVKFVERFAQRLFPAATQLPAGSNTGVEDSWFVDGGLDYALTYPNATITFSGSTGTIQVTADSAIFTYDHVGRVLRAGGGIGTVTALISPTVIEVELDKDIYEVLPNDPTVVLPQTSGNWSLTEPITTVTGLWHLEGKTVKILADGSVLPDQTVTNGTITLAQPASRIIIGLGYQAQFQTLDLEAGQGTMQGRFKKLSGLTIKYENTRGIKYGPTFDDLVEVKERGASVAMGQAIPLGTGQTHVNMPASWNVEGRVCIQQDYPLPMTILAVVPEVTPGSDPE